MRKFTQSPGPLPTWKGCRDLHPPEGVGSDLPGHKNSAHHFGGRIMYRWIFYTWVWGALSFRCVTLRSSEEEGQAFSPYLFGSVTAVFLLSMHILNTERKKKFPKAVRATDALSLDFLHPVILRSSTLWGYIALLEEEGRAFEPFLLRECNCDFSLSFFFYTYIYQRRRRKISRDRMLFYISLAAIVILSKH